MKILYAAGNRYGSFFQLKRFLESVKNKNYQIKTAAYTKSIGNLNVDYTLDCLLNFTNENGPISFNGNYRYYYNEIKRFMPDLIISDFDIYTSIIALESNIKLWQVSPVLLYSGMSNTIKYNSGIYKNHSYLLNQDFHKKEYVNFVLNNSDKKFILSHLCDSANPPELNTGYEWARPEFILGEKNKTKTDFLIVSMNNNKNIIDEFRKRHSIMFSNFHLEQYERLVMKDIFNQIEYKNCIDSCRLFISDGIAIFLADAFYNQKFCVSVPRHDDVESVIASYMNEYCGVGKIAVDNFDTKGSSIDITINDNVSFLHKHLGKL